MSVKDLVSVRPSFLRGMARALDLGATLDEYPPRRDQWPTEADARALAGDWYRVGADLQRATGQVKSGIHVGRNGEE